jgi:hypothetical protein
MAYISTETVKEMRNTIKNVFPSKDGWKFSVKRDHYSSVSCSILQAPIELRIDENNTNENVNNFWINSRYNGLNYKATEILNAINDILNLNNYDRSDVQSDYFDVGHYVTMRIGEWDKPFIKI